MLFIEELLARFLIALKHYFILELKGTSQSKQITINIVPTPCFPYKMAALMDTRTTACGAVARDELDFSVVGVNYRVAAHFQTQPLRAVVSRHVSGAGAPIPCG